MFPPPPPLVPAPPPPLPAHPPLYRDPKDALSRREAEALVDSLVAKKIAAMAAAGLIPVKQGDPGDPGPRGVTFTPHVSSAGVLSWTNDGGLDNPEPVVVKGLKGDPGSDGTVNAQTLASVNAALADFQNAYSQLSAAVAAAQNAATAAATARTDANAAVAALSSLSGMQTLPARVAALELDYGNYLNQIRSPNAMTKVKAKNDGTAVVERVTWGGMSVTFPEGFSISVDGGRYQYQAPAGGETIVFVGPYHVFPQDVAEEYRLRLWIPSSYASNPSDFTPYNNGGEWFMEGYPGSNFPNYLGFGLIDEGEAYDVSNFDANSPTLKRTSSEWARSDIEGPDPTTHRAWKAVQYPITIGATPVAESHSSDWME